MERRWTSNKTKRGVGAEEFNSEDPKRPLWKPNLHYQDAMPLEPLAAYSCNVYMYIIMGCYFFDYHLCFDVLCYFYTEPTKQVHDFISQYDHIIAESLSNYNSFIHIYIYRMSNPKSDKLVFMN